MTRLPIVEDGEFHEPVFISVQVHLSFIHSIYSAVSVCSLLAHNKSFLAARSAKLHCIPINDARALYLPTYEIHNTGLQSSTKFQPLADIETLGHGSQDEMVTHRHTHVTLVETSWSLP